MDIGHTLSRQMSIAKEALGSNPQGKGREEDQEPSEPQNRKLRKKGCPGINWSGGPKTHQDGVSFLNGLGFQVEFSWPM